jgi:hypothetical protein
VANRYAITVRRVGGFVEKSIPSSACPCFQIPGRFKRGGVADAGATQFLSQRLDEFAITYAVSTSQSMVEVCSGQAETPPW